MTTTTNLIEHLRNPEERLLDWDLLDEAADLLEAQARQIEVLRADWKAVSYENGLLRPKIEALQAESEYWRARYAALAQKGVNV